MNCCQPVDLLLSRLYLRPTDSDLPTVGYRETLLSNQEVGQLRYKLFFRYGTITTHVLTWNFLLNFVDQPSTVVRRLRVQISSEDKKLPSEPSEVGYLSNWDNLKAKEASFRLKIGFKNLLAHNGILPIFD